MSTHRWLKFWPQDWQTDPGLRSCSLAARGLWIECMAVMHGAEPYGHLVVNGIMPSDKRLAVMVGSTEREVSKLLAELREAGVCSIAPDGSIYSRRMVRDARVSQEGRDAISKRWTKKASDDTPNREPIHHPNSPPNRGPCSLETEAEAETEDTSLRSVSPARAARSLPPDPRGFAEFWAAYPAKVGKAAARKAFPKAVKAAGGDPDAIVFGLKARLHLFPPDPQFIPNPATWLNQGRWDDDPDTLFARTQRSN